MTRRLPDEDRAPNEVARPRRRGWRQWLFGADDAETQAQAEAHLLAWFLARLGRNDRALAELRRAVAGGFWAAEALARDTAFDGLRAEPAYADMLAQAKRQRDEARTAFRQAGGERLVGGSEG